MSDMIFKTDGEENFRIPSLFSNNYYDLPKTPKTKLEVKKMTSNKEIELLKQEIKMLESKLAFLEEVEKHNDKPKMTLQNEGEFSIVSYGDGIYYRLQLPICISWYIKTMDDYGNVSLDLVDDVKTKNQLEIVWLKNEVKYQNDSEPYCPDDPSWYDEVEHDISENVENMTIRDVIDRWWMDTFTSKNQWDVDTCIDDLADQVEFWILRNKKIEELKEGTTPPEPTSVFRQKLFDGIKSVFYDPEYERTHWKMKVDMAVDEVLTHFEDILPEPQEPIYDDTDKGWNWCLSSIRTSMENPNV
jgi:hypothetical protein